MEISELMKKLAISDIEGTDKDGNTSLHLTVKNKNVPEKEVIEILKTLLDKGINVNAKNKRNETALQLSVCNRMRDTADFLVERKANFDGVAHAFVADEFQKFCSLRRYFDYSYIPDHELIEKETEGACFAEWLVSRGLDFDDKDDKERSALHMAVEYDLQHILPVLLKSTKEINSIDKKNRTLLRWFLEKKYDYDDKKESYSERYAADIVKILLDKGAITASEVNTKDKNGTTLIHLAASYGNPAVLKILIEHGGNVNCRNKLRETPLHLAINEHDKVVEMIELLLENGANVNAKDSNGWTALHRVATVSRLQRPDLSLHALLKYGADVNATDRQKRSVLYCARAQDSEDHRRDSQEYIQERIEKGYELNEMAMDDFEIDEYASQVVICLAEQSNRLKAANLPWDKAVNSYLGNFEMFRDDYNHVDNHYRQCSKEIKKLKNNHIDSSTTLYDFLHMNLKSKYIFINNDKLQNLVKNETKLVKEFPEYEVLILASYHEAMTRNSLMEPAKDAWLELTNIVLPDLCLEHIFSFLSNSDLFDIIEND